MTTQERVMKLWRVTVEVELVLVADSRDKAEHEAECLVKVKYDGAEVCANASLIRSKEDLPHEWDEGTIPFSEKNGKTIGQYLADPKRNP